MLLVPNGEDIGYAMGDFDPYLKFVNITNNITTAQGKMLPHRSTAFEKTDSVEERVNVPPHPWGVFFTILGTVLLDFDADACQSPARAYLLDVTIPEDHARGLSTFTIMAGLGGFMGYSLGGINWDETSIGIALGGHVRAVFTLITIIFIVCVMFTVTSFKEIPLKFLEISAPEIILDDDDSIKMAMKNDNLGTPLKKCNAGHSYGALDDILDNEEPIVVCKNKQSNS